MCGIAGILTSNFIDADCLSRMTNVLVHRGPNDYGSWYNSDTGIGLAHRRLSIVDLSPAGHQPMHTASGRYVMAFNGEIYNHSKLRTELEHAGQAPTWRGHSDTETLLASFEAWGIEATLQRCIGMFAIALWDKQTQTLTLARDRLGEKPLYYGWQGNTFLFASELKAIKAHPDFRADIDRDALCLYIRRNYIPAPHSIYQGISKLLPGTWLQVSHNQREPNIKTYWSGVDISRQGKKSPFMGSPEDATNALEDLLKDSIKQQMIADVPLGAFLSGGVDSSTVVALMQAQSSQPIKTFSIGFHEKDFNEAIYAKSIANHLGTDHTELYVTPEECMQVIPQLPKLYDEPFADSSQIPTFLVSQLARQHVTVSLSGDGGDELFAGYKLYSLTSSAWEKLSRVPHPLRLWVKKALESLPPDSWRRIANTLKPIIPALGQLENIGSKLHKSAGVMASHSSEDAYLGIISSWQNPSDIIIDGTEPPTFFTGYLPDLGHLNSIERMMVIDMLSYLPDDILCKVDRATMGISLESRIPFLDHRVVELASQLPLEYKLRGNETKWVLRQVLYRHVPKELIERPKTGFSMPINEWLRGPLHNWAEELLSEKRLQRDGYFNPKPIRLKWEEHLSGQHNWHQQLWGILMFNQWLED